MNRLWRFLTYDIWRITENEVTQTKYNLYNIIKSIYLCIVRFQKNRLFDQASALTYSTLLAIVPLLAILFAIARGFDMSTLLEGEIRSAFRGNDEATEVILQFVNSYLSQTKTGVFIGFGVVMLLWTVINLVGNIETTFNRIWEVNKERSIYRKITDYFSMFLLMPILIVTSSGLSIYMSTALQQVEGFLLLAPIIKFLIRMLPFVFIWLIFTGLYIFMPNTNVKFKYAFVAGIVAGTVYQAFQYLYISGQIWVSKYNAIYGSFAALPLFLLWLQVSWTICLFGAELAYAGQNIQNYNFDQEMKSISRRYRDFVAIIILSVIAKRFERGEQPYTAIQISNEHKIPYRLTNQTLNLLVRLQLINEVLIDEDPKNGEIAYQPAMAISQLSVATFLERLDNYGSEEFKIDKEHTFHSEWEVLLQSKLEYYRQTSHILFKDL